MEMDGMESRPLGHPATICSMTGMTSCCLQQKKVMAESLKESKKKGERGEEEVYGRILMGEKMTISLSSEGEGGEDNETYGGHDSDSMYIKLISADYYEFILKKEVALLSGTVRRMVTELEEDGEDSNEILLDEVSSGMLHKVILFLHYKARFSRGTGEMPDEFPIESDIAKSLITAAYYLQC